MNPENLSFFQRPLFLIVSTLWFMFTAGSQIQAINPGTAVVERDTFGVPTITAANDTDAFRMLGYVQAQDRFFQMDMNRRQFSGTLAELMGPGYLGSDIQLRTLGLRRAAEASLPILSVEAIQWMEAYSQGINDYLADHSADLPPEYAELEITINGIPAWTVLDTMTVMKGLAFAMAFDLSDLNYTEAYLAFEAAGSQYGFDGSALFYEDLYRSQPFDPTVSIPEWPLKSLPQSAPSKTWTKPAYLDGHTLEMIRTLKQTYSQIEILNKALSRLENRSGSNWWVVSGAATDSGYPMLANDPHLALDTPATFYEVRIRVQSPEHPLDVFGVTFPGALVIAVGCNQDICWGATINPMDVTDIYQESLVVNFVSLRPTHTRFGGHQEPLITIQQTFRVNQPADQTDDNLVTTDIGPLEGGLTLIVPRRNNGPIIAVDAGNLFDVTALSIQFTGWGATREADAFRLWARARNLNDFRQGLEYFDYGSQNVAYADVDGNIAYFTVGEMPVREDLQNLAEPDGGVPPYMVRDGTHQLQHEWLPVQNPQPNQSLAYEILPPAEMPHVINPPSGYILNANNDPVGTCVDNNAFNQLRPGGGIFYLNPGYDGGFRMGRIQRLFDDALSDDGKLGFEQIRQFQSDNRMLDAEFFVPYLLRAYDQAVKNPAWLSGHLAFGPGVSEAVERLRNWDFSTPTGITAGFDPGDDPDNLIPPSPEEIAASVAATIYAVWRGQLVQQIIDYSLAGYGLQGDTPGSQLALSALRNLLNNFASNQGIGASGIHFIPGGDLDTALLGALEDALALLAGPPFDEAFHGSTSQDDYRWGYLHRIVFDHPLNQPYNIPPAGGLDHLNPALPGLARSGGFGTVDESSHSVRADSVNEFMFGSGPVRRFVGRLTTDGITLEQVIPGGSSGVLGDLHQADELRLWLTNRYIPRDMIPDKGDLNQDLLINAVDVFLLSAFISDNSSPAFTAPIATADLNNDGTVNVVDQVLLNLMSVKNHPVIPE